jgi:hypothetical protein
MAGEWNPRTAMRNALRHLRLAKSALSDERLDQYRFDTGLVSPLVDEMYELRDVVDDLSSRGDDFNTELLEDNC